MMTSTRPVPENYNPEPLRDVLAWRKKKQKPQLVTYDGFPVHAEDPLRESYVLLHDYLKAVGRRDADKLKVAEVPEGRAILDTPQEQWGAHLRAAVARLLFN